MRLIFTLRDKLVFICHEASGRVGSGGGFGDLSGVYQAIIDTGKANFCWWWRMGVGMGKWRSDKTACDSMKFDVQYRAGRVDNEFQKCFKTSDDSHSKPLAILIQNLRRFSSKTEGIVTL
jgi:hypothetical protein